MYRNTFVRTKLHTYLRKYIRSNIDIPVLYTLHLYIYMPIHIYTYTPTQVCLYAGWWKGFHFGVPGIFSVFLNPNSESCWWNCHLCIFPWCRLEKPNESGHQRHRNAVLPSPEAKLRRRCFFFQTLLCWNFGFIRYMSVLFIWICCFICMISECHSCTFLIWFLKRCFPFACCTMMKVLFQWFLTEGNICPDWIAESSGGRARAQEGRSDSSYGLLPKFRNRLTVFAKKHSVLVFHKSSAGVVLGCWWPCGWYRCEPQ